MSNVPKRKRRAYRALLLIPLIALGLLAILGTGGGGGGSSAVPPVLPNICVWDTSNWDAEANAFAELLTPRCN